MESNVKHHYNRRNLTREITHALARSGKPLSGLDIRDLSVIDQMHTGGLWASMALIDKAGLDSGHIILDAGCGIGGSARLFAKETGCRVTGIDLADQFIDAAVYLTRCTGLDALATFQQGSVSALPFRQHTFDAVLCQHILMNIKEKTTVLKELYRVLKPGGKLILHEISKGKNSRVAYPVPWAAGPGISFLEPWETTLKRIEDLGFTVLSCSNETEAARSWWEKVNTVSRARQTRPHPNPINPGLIFGSNAKQFGRNMSANFQNNAICLIEAVLKKK